jgi:hypothetical protein
VGIGAFACGGALALPSAAGAASNDQLACELAPEASVRSFLGLGHSERILHSTSPTSASPDDHTFDGSDVSECETFAWNGTKPSSSTLRKLVVPGPSRYKTPSGLGTVIVTTYVRDPAEGESWEPDAFYVKLVAAALHDKQQLGGTKIGNLPSLGANKLSLPGSAEFFGVTLGHFGDFAVGAWHKNDSIVELQVAVPQGRAALKLKTLAAKIVPKF